MTPWTMAFFVALTSSMVLYVYRFTAFGVNLSLFRLVFIAWCVKLVVDLARGRVRLDWKHWPFLALAALITGLCAVDFAGLSGFPGLRRDLANHLVNVALAGLIVVYLDTQEKISALLRAFVYSSVVTTAITVHSSLTGAIPFDWAIRAAGSEMGRALPYLNDDKVFARATSAFFDPNFYGVYSMLVIAAIVYLRLFDRRSRELAAFLAVNLVCLTLTLSRTAVIAVLVVFAVTFVLSPPSRRFAAGAAVATIALLYASTAFQSYAVYERMGGQVRDGWSTVTGWLAPVIGGERPGDTQRTARNSARPPEGTDVEVDLGLRARVSSGSSLAVRVEYIKRGIAVFEASPIVGQGSASLTTPTVPWSSAHMSYLTLLARYGIVGAAIYAAFLLAPLAVVWRRGVPPGPRLLVTLAIVPLLAVYLSYDIFMSFEVQYIFFGLVHAVAAHRPWATQAAPARHA